MAHGLRKYWTEVDRIAAERGISRAEARKYFATPNNRQLRSAVKAVEAARAEVRDTPEQVVANAQERVAELETKIDQYKQWIAACSSELSRWQEIAGSLNDVLDRFNQDSNPLCV